MSEIPTIYTAGAMRWENSEDSYWRESVEARIEGAEFLHPYESYFDHGGDIVSGAVSEDTSMIRRADAVVALFSENPQVGTITEVLHAVHTDTPVLAMFTEDLLDDYVFESPIENDDEAGIEEGDSPGVWMRANSPDHWFLINYLQGDSIGERPEVLMSLPEWVQEWEGAQATVSAVKDEDSDAIPAIISSWVESGFTSVNPSEE